MIEASQTLERPIGDALKACSSHVKQTGSGQWAFQLSNGAPLQVAAQVADGWLELDAPVSTGKKCASIKPTQLWNLVRWNTGLPGCAKFAVMPGRRSAHLRAEIPLGDDVPLTERIGQTCRGYTKALGRFHGSGDSSQDGRGGLCDRQDKAPQEDVKALCKAAGWEFSERRSGLSVELDVPGGFYQATLDQRTSGGIGVSVEIVTVESPAKETCRSLGLLLLRACGIVKMARAAVHDGDKRTAVRFEVILGGCPVAAEINHALSALSVACRLCGQEARALQDEAVAREYWTACGWS